jgi:hypothetical protein
LLVYCAESTVRWFIVKEKYCWMAAGLLCWKYYSTFRLYLTNFVLHTCAGICDVIGNLEKLFAFWSKTRLRASHLSVKLRLIWHAFIISLPIEA